MQPGNPPRRRGASAIALAALALACALAPASAGAAAARPGDGALSARLAPKVVEDDGAFAPGEAIVRFEPGAPPAIRRDARDDANVEFADTVGLPHAQLVSLDGSVEAAVRRLERQPGVAYAQPNYRYQASAPAPIPDDTFFDELWGLSDPAMPDPGVGALEAWEVGEEGDGQVIAVLDTGVDLTHPDLVGNLWTNPSPGIDGDVHGYDFVDGDGDPDDYNFHGTHVAGTAAASAGNNLGVAGVAPQAEIMAVRVLDGDGSGTTADIAAGIDYAADNAAGVINMSLGGPASSGGDKAMSEAIARAGEADTVVVVAAGNEGADNDTDPHTPCALSNPNIICVAALNQSGSLAGFSNYGLKTVDIAAPGTSTLSAKTDYGPSLFTDDFESGLGLWTTEAFDGGKLWGESSNAAGGVLSATDSPGEDYGQQEAGAEFLAESVLYTSSPVDLSGERGCREHFRAAYEIEPSDGFFAGAFASGLASSFDGELFDGTSPGFPKSFSREQASVSELDNRSDVHAILAILSDEEIELDGAYVDDLRLFCRDESYVNEIANSSNYDQPGSGNYVRFAGTSMATPHVAGVVALVRSAAPGLSLQQVISAVLDGASAIPDPDPERPTATFGIADACKAIAVATGSNIEVDCPASTTPVIPPPPEEEEEAEEETPPASPLPPADIAPPPLSQPRDNTDRVRPHTFFRHRPPRLIRTRHRTARVVFRFRSNEAGVTFLCQWDRRRYRVCRERFVRRFGRGRHVLRVKARDAAGNVDRTPAVHRFRVKRVPKRR